MQKNKTIGNLGEKLAREYLEQHGHTILHQNFTCRWGELDIVCEKSSKIIFVEVKTRIGLYRGKAYENIHPRKLQHLKRSMQYYLLKYGLFKAQLQLDAITILLDKNCTLIDFQHYENVHL